MPRMKSIASVLSIIALGFGLFSCSSSGGGSSTSTFAVSTTAANFGVVGSTYTSTLAATGGTAPFTWTLFGGVLPTGSPAFFLDPGTGIVSGTPTVVGNFNATFTVTDSTGQTATGSVLFAIHPRTDLVSIDNSIPPVPGGPGGAVSSSPSISNDGRFVAFASTAGNLILGVGGSQIYLHDWQTNQTSLVSRDSGVAITPGDGIKSAPSISSDGHFVAFVANSTNLVTGVSGQQIYLRDVQTGVTSLVSKDNFGHPATLGSTTTSPSISSKGRFIAYISNATNLVPSVLAQQIYLYDTQTSVVFPNGQTTLISKDNSPTPLPGDGVSSAPSISQDGCFVAFASLSTNLISPAPGNQQIYVRGPLPGPGICGASEQTSLISEDKSVSPVPGSGLSSTPSISSNGRFVTFTSVSSNLTLDPAPGPSQIFLRDTQSSTTTLVSQATGVAVAVGNGASSNPTISADGGFVAFTSLATTLAPTPGGSGTQIFLRNTQANTTSLVSHDVVGNAGNGASSQPTISADGGFVSFSSVSTNLGANGNQIYVRALP